MVRNGGIEHLPREWDRAAYPAAEAARLVGLSAARVRRWLTGYEYSYQSMRRHQDPVVHRKGTAGTTYASFLDLVDLLFVKRFLDHGVSLQRVRRALEEAEEILGAPHFARNSFFTDGHNIYMEVRERGDAILQLLSGGQWVIAPIIQELGHQIDFDSPTGLARRWYPQGPDGLVVLDPAISFGRPTIVNKGIATNNIFDLFVAEREETDRVCDWLQLTPEEVRAAVRFEKRLAA